MNKTEQLRRVAEMKSAGKSRGQMAIALNVSVGTIRLRLKELNPKNKLVMTFASKLAELATEAPDGYCRRELMRTVANLRKDIAILDEEKKRRILELLSVDTPVEITDIMQQLQLHRSDVENLLKQMVKTGTVIESEKGGIHNRGRKKSFNYKKAKLPVKKIN